MVIVICWHDKKEKKWKRKIKKQNLGYLHESCEWVRDGGHRSQSDGGNWFLDQVDHGIKKVASMIERHYFVYVN